MFNYRKDIREFMEKNNIEDNLDISKPIEILGILRIDKIDKFHWKVRIRGPKESFYKNGIFSVTIDFPEDFPKRKPDVRIVEKIYHLNVSPTNGHISIGFLNQWIPSPIIAELLVGIYLAFAGPQDPENPYSIDQSREFKTNLGEFARKADEWTLKFAPFSNYDLVLINEMNFYKMEKLMEKKEDKKINELEEKLNQMKQEIINLKQENLRLKKIENDYNASKLEVLELHKDLRTKEKELKELKSKLPFELNKDETLLTIIFISLDQKLHYSLLCKNTSRFNTIENILYEKFPEYRKTENYFISNGRTINKSMTLEENKIKSSDVIILNPYVA